MKPWEKYQNQSDGPWSKYQGKQTEKPSPVFKTEAEGRQASAQAETERKQLQDAASPLGFARNQVVGGINTAIDTAGGGAPERALNMMGTSMMPPNTTPEVKAAGTLAGASFGLPMKAATGAGQLMAKSPEILKMMGMGAAGGASYVPSMVEQPTAGGALGQMAIQSTIGAALGTAFGLGTQAVRGVAEYMGLNKEIKGYEGQMATEAGKVGAFDSSKESIIRKSREAVTTKVEPLKSAIEKETSTFKDVKDSLSKEIGNQPQLRKEDVRLTKLAQSDYKKNVLDVAKGHVKELETALKGKAEEVVKYLKDTIPSRIKDINKAFGDHIDSISETMDKWGVGVGRREVHNIVKATKEEAEALGINSGKMKEVLDQWHGRLSKELQGTEEQVGYDLITGRPKMEVLGGKGSETIPLRDFLFEARTFRRMLSAPQLSGAQGLNDEQIVGALFNKNFNRYLSESIPSYRSMQQEYAPVINAMKTARKIFKPGEIYDDVQGVNLLKKFALEGTSSKGVTAGKAQLLGDVQKSSNFGEGMGDITSEISAMGKGVQQARKSIGDLNQNLQKKFSDELASVEKSYVDRTRGLKGQLEEAKNSSQLKKDTIQSKIDEIEREHSNRVTEISDTADKLSALEKQRASTHKKAAIIGGTALTVGGVLGTSFGQQIYRGTKQAGALIGMGN